MDGQPELETLSSHRYFEQSRLGHTGYNYMGGHSWFSDHDISAGELRNGVITFSDGTVGLIDTAHDEIDLSPRRYRETMEM